MIEDNQIQKKVDNFFLKSNKVLFEKGKVIIEAGENPSGIFYLKKGLVRQFDIANSGQKVTLNVFKPKAFFPMSWAINRTPNKYFFEAMDNCLIKTAPANETVNFLKSNPEVLFDLLSRVYKGTDGLLARQFSLMTGTAEDRLAYELELYFMRFEHASRHGRYKVKLKKTELASFTGLARETVSRQLKKMSNDGLLTIKGQDIIIEDFGKFRR